jgi:hypothetical protein
MGKQNTEMYEYSIRSAGNRIRTHVRADILVASRPQKHRTGTRATKIGNLHGMACNKPPTAARETPCCMYKCGLAYLVLLPET